MISYGSRAFKTRKIKHTLNPEWNQKLFIQIRKEEVDKNYPVQFHVYDHDKISHHDSVGKAALNIQEFLNLAPKVSRLENAPTIFETTSCSLVLDLSKETESRSILNVKYSFMPFSYVRRNFWLTLCQLYDANNNGSLNEVELTTMLDSIGSTYSQDSIRMLFTGLTADGLSFEKVYDAIEALLTSEGKEGGAEHLIQLTKCPVCKKRIKEKHDLDVVSHVAVRSRRFYTLRLTHLALFCR